MRVGHSFTIGSQLARGSPLISKCKILLYRLSLIPIEIPLV